MPGARCARSLACKSKKAHECRHHGHTGTPGIPYAMVLTAYFVLSPVIGVLVTVICFRRLDAGVEASGPHGFAVREAGALVEAQPASTASHPASVTIAIRPSRGRDGAGYIADLG